MVTLGLVAIDPIGLQMHIAGTGSVSLCAEKLTDVWNWNLRSVLAASCLDKVARVFRNSSGMKTSIPSGLITFVLACFEIAPLLRAVVASRPTVAIRMATPRKGKTHFKAPPPAASTLRLVGFRSLRPRPAVSILLLVLERLTSTPQTTIRLLA